MFATFVGIPFFWICNACHLFNGILDDSLKVQICSPTYLFKHKDLKLFRHLLAILVCRLFVYKYDILLV